MDWLEAIVLGVVQGLTEFLPISSSAHISIFGQLFFNGSDPGSAFTAVTSWALRPQCCSTSARTSSGSSPGGSGR